MLNIKPQKKTITENRTQTQTFSNFLIIFVKSSVRNFVQ
jgi:hypothetical protein